MHHFIEQTHNVLANLKAYPVIGAFIIFAIFALIAGAALYITGKMMRSGRPGAVHQLGKTIYNTFAEKNITIPFPQRDVHLQH